MLSFISEFFDLSSHKNNDDVVSIDSTKFDDEYSTETIVSVRSSSSHSSSLLLNKKKEEVIEKKEKKISPSRPPHKKMLPPKNKKDFFFFVTAKNKKNKNFIRQNRMSRSSQYIDRKKKTTI